MTGSAGRAMAVLVLLWFLLTGVSGPTLGRAGSLDSHVAESGREEQAESEPWSAQEALAGIAVQTARSPRSGHRLPARLGWTAPQRARRRAGTPANTGAYVPVGRTLPLRC